MFILCDLLKLTRQEVGFDMTLKQLSKKVWALMVH